MHKSSWSQSMLKKCCAFLEPLARKQPLVYKILITVFALSGYLYLLLFPLLVVLGLNNIYQALTSDAIVWQTIVAWALVVLLSGLVSYRIGKTRVSAPAGLALTEDKAPEIYKLEQKLNAHYKLPTIHRIMITGEYELDIIKTPKWGIPIWSTNTLIIGLPVLQSMSPEQFQCMVARRIGQFSKRYNPVTNWLYQLRDIWQQYRVYYAKDKKFGQGPLRWFFAVYAPLYSAISIFTAWQDEMAADTYAMTLFNDLKVLEMITADSLCKWFLLTQYWPAIDRKASAEPKTILQPHAAMASTLRSKFFGDNMEKWVEKYFSTPPDWRNTTPVLLDRIENIGHSKPRLNTAATETAATHYLGASINGVISLFDKLWFKNLLDERKKHQRQPLVNKIKAKLKIGNIFKPGIKKAG